MKKFLVIAVAVMSMTAFVGCGPKEKTPAPEQQEGIMADTVEPAQGEVEADEEGDLAPTPEADN